MVKRTVFKNASTNPGRLFCIHLSSLVLHLVSFVPNSFTSLHYSYTTLNFFHKRSGKIAAAAASRSCLGESVLVARDLGGFFVLPFYAVRCSGVDS